MPIYEFYCPDCHTVFSFFSSRVAPDAHPACPKCRRPDLGRRPSRFATPAGGRRQESEGEEASPFGDLDEQRLERAFDSMAGEMGDFAEGEHDDPRTLARFFRKFSHSAGLEPGPRMEEMLRRLEAGEDPDALESELGDDLGEDAGLEEFFNLRKQAKADRRPPPKVDETLYWL